NWRNWRQPDLALDTPAERFFAVTLPDVVHAARRQAALGDGVAPAAAPSAATETAPVSEDRGDRENRGDRP
ncbi:glycosyltransferase family 1 protein, partial [Desulfovibrio oxamicus]|nr:glycosyltransferase family 1 protein [Nitratidesulfovibrio oxamicus]